MWGDLPLNGGLAASRDFEKGRLSESTAASMVGRGLFASHPDLCEAFQVRTPPPSKGAGKTRIERR